jgi:hypothetical protein
MNAMLKRHESRTKLEFKLKFLFVVYCPYLGLPEERPGEADELTLTHG